MPGSPATSTPSRACERYREHELVPAALEPTHPFEGYPLHRRRRSRGDLLRFAGFSLPDPCPWPLHEVQERPGVLDIILDGGDLLPRYHLVDSA